MNETQELIKELENLKAQQQELIELGDFELAHELEQDISYVKAQIGDTSTEFSHII